MVERIVSNLVANAVKYTTTGGILLSCRERRAPVNSVKVGQAPSPHHFRIEVWDTGPGIATTDRTRVFEKYAQLDTGRGGIGMGLHIVQRLVRLIGGSLLLRSRVGHGTLFALCLPITHANEPAIQAPRAGGQTTGRESLAGLFVAVMDDDAEVRNSLSLLLQRWGCRVVAGECAADIRAAVTLATRPCVAVVDYRLGAGRTGPREVAALEAEVGARLPTLIVTGETSGDALEDIRSCGYASLGKPVEIQRLHAWLLAELADVA
jgi:CheY-like chemotaxis protein